MSAPTETHTGDATSADPSLAVVAEESADGTYEIRVTRGGATPSAGPVVVAGPPSSESRSPGAERGRGAGAGGVSRAAVGAGAAVAAAGVVALAIVARPAPEFSPPPIPAPAALPEFEIFRIAAPTLPSVSRSVLTYDAGGGPGEGEASGAGFANAATAPALQRIEPLPGSAEEAPPQQPAPEVVPLVDEVPDLDEVTRNQLREIQVEAPTLVGTPDFAPPIVGSPPSE